MAATDTKRVGLNNQKRSVSVMVSEQLASAAGSSGIPLAVVTDGSTVATLPDKSLITGVVLMVSAASDTSDTIDVTYAGNVIANEIEADATGANVGTLVDTATYSATGGDIVVKNGSQPVDTTFRGRLIVTYVELDKVTGEYTA